MLIEIQEGARLAPLSILRFNPLIAKNSHILEHSDFNMLGVFLNLLDKLGTCIHFSH